MSNLICVIAGGEWQAPIINKLQTNGFEVLCLNLYADTSGAKLANYFEKVDVIDKAACLAIVKKYSVRAVLTDQSDISVPTVAYIAEQLNLPGIGLECAELFTNKLLMRTKAKALGVHCPQFYFANDKENVKALAEKIGLPVIIKPINSQASRGVIIIKAWDELEAAVTEAFLYTKFGEPILVEEYIDGQEWTVEGFKQHQQHTSLAISYKEHFDSTPTVASSINYVPIQKNALHQQLINQNDYLVEGMRLNFGITHAEYKYANDKFYLIEIAARGGGANISSHIIPIMSGVDANQLLIDQVVNKPDIVLSAQPTGQYAVVAFLDFKSGKVKTRTAESQVTNLPFVADFKYNFEIDQVIEPISNDTSRHAHVILFADTECDLDKHLLTIKELIEVSYE